MTSINAPCVMVSSTYYDLRQVRTDLEEFLSRNLRYRPLLSEFPSFPVDPDRTTGENCRVRVERNADILVLVIGGRYGSLDGRSGKSVTNLEYLAARAKGIPVYAFVEKSILALLPVWEANPDGDFSRVVDNPRVFAFVKDVRTKDSVWTFGFETAQDIITTLQLQFAHLFRESLALSAKLRESDSKRTLDTLSGAAFALALERPPAWEYRLFGQVLEDEIRNHADLKTRYQLGLVLGPGERVSLHDIEAWTAPRFHELQRVVHALNHVINNSLPEALGPPGHAGNIEQIVSVARLIGEAYREALEWSLRVRRAATDDQFRPVVTAMGRFPDDLLRKVESLGAPLLARVEEALALPATDKPARIEITLVITLSNLEEYQSAMQKLQDDMFGSA